MAGKIIFWIVSFGCAALFYGIGVFAEKYEKPMWFWSGTEVKPSQISDIKAYNKENAVMWKLYSLWYFASGIAEIWNSIAALVIMLASFVIGFPILVYTYTKIFNKYKS